MSVLVDLFLKGCERCGHFFHDIEEPGDPIPICCNEDCSCGKTAEDKIARDAFFNDEGRA